MNIIKDYRVRKKWSVIGLAERMKVHRQTIYKWEDGVEPSIPQIVKLSALLGVSSSSIFKYYASVYINKEEVK